MLKSVETHAWNGWDNVERKRRYKELFNTTDTYLSIFGRYNHIGWENLVQRLKDNGYKVNVLYDGKAINHYVSHRDEYQDTDERRFCQRLVIYEFDEVPK